MTLITVGDSIIAFILDNPGMAEGLVGIDCWCAGDCEDADSVLVGIEVRP